MTLSTHWSDKIRCYKKRNSLRNWIVYGIPSHINKSNIVVFDDTIKNFSASLQEKRRKSCDGNINVNEPM